MNLIKAQKDFQRKTIELIKENSEELGKRNKNILMVLVPFFTLVMGIFWFAAYSAFEAWNIAWFYRDIFFIFLVFSLYLLLFYRNEVQTYKQITSLCVVYHLAVMLVVGFVSIYPVELHQPAVYFVPVAMGLCCAFTYSWYTNIFVTAIESVLFIACSYMFKQQQIFLIDLFSCCLGFLMILFVATSLLQKQIQMEEVKLKYKRSSMIDSLTGLYNKASSRQLVMDYFRENNPKGCTYMIVDLDNFKYINDEFGHYVGDSVLSDLGNILKHETGEYGFAGRIGGDEFVVFLKNVDPGFGEEIASKILRDMHQIKNPNGDCTFSCSIGVYYTDNKVMDYDDMYTAADKALYRAKAGGKDSFFSYDEQLYQIL